jgi:hypothetical protein
VFGEHFFWVYGYEDAAAAGQDFVFFVQDFGGVDVLGSADFDFAALYSQWFVERDWLKVFDRHLSGQGYDVMELVYFSHGVVEDAGDYASVAMAGWSGVAVSQAKFADEGLAGFV